MNSRNLPLTQALMAETQFKPANGSKKYKNEDLPRGIDRHEWHRVFVPTFMTHVARKDNPFENNITTGLTAMQKIWNFLFSDVLIKSFRVASISAGTSWLYPLVYELKNICYRLCNVSLTHGGTLLAQPQSLLSLPTARQILT